MYGSQSYSAQLTNNPFIAENASHPSNRYPDLSQQAVQPPQWTDPTLLTNPPQSQYQPDIYQQQYPSVQQQQIPSGYPPHQQQFQQHQHQQIQPPNYPPPFQPPPQPISQPTTSPFQPSSSFGQSLQVSMGSSGYYLPTGQPPPQQTTPAYNPAQQQLNNPNYVAQLDPYGTIPQAWNADTVTPQSQQTHSSTNVNNSNFPYSNQSNRDNLGYSRSGDPHPREYIRSHRQEIEAWDSYTWKQLLNSCEALKFSWESRRNELKTKLAGLQNQHRYAGYYDRTQIQQEGDRIQGLLNEAQSNFDSASASTFQFEESFNGYRQSGDTSSKKRVREATNAALQCLPKWPEPRQ